MGFIKQAKQASLVTEAQRAAGLSPVPPVEHEPAGGPLVIATTMRYVRPPQVGHAIVDRLYDDAA